MRTGSLGESLRNDPDMWKGARKELRTEVLARAATSCVYTALYQVTLRHLNSEIPNTVDGEHEGDEGFGAKQVGVSFRVQPWKAVSNRSLKNPGTSRRRQSPMGMEGGERCTWP